VSSPRHWHLHNDDATTNFDFSGQLYTGSVAAGLQSNIGNVVVGSLFATAQSAAMGGGVPAIVTAVGTGIAGVAGAAAGATSAGAGVVSMGATAASAVGAAGAGAVAAAAGIVGKALPAAVLL
jgi:hypothetical protein